MSGNNTLCTRCAEWVDTDHACAPKRTERGHLVKQPRETWSDFRLRRDLDRKARRDVS